MAEKFSKEWVEALPSTDLRVIIATTSPDGKYAAQLGWATAELQRRPKDASHNSHVHSQWHAMEVL